MNIGRPLTPPTWRSSLLIALAGHLLFSVLVIWGPALGLFPKRDQGPEIMMVRLQGGGQNVPGWVKPTTAQADEAVVPDNKPKAKPKPKPEETKPAPPKEEPKAPPKTEEPKPVHQQPEKTQQPEPESTAEEAPAEQAAPAEMTDAQAEETGAGIGAKPGPEGPGIGAHSDADFPGANLFLSRVETEVQRRFNFRGRGTKSVAEYHFFITKNGTLKELLLVKSSGIPSLDLAARSALMRAKFPPLPPGFGHDKLGVTYRFYDDK